MQPCLLNCLLQCVQYGRYGEKTINVFFLILFLVMRPNWNLAFFHRASINIVHQTRLSFDLDIDTITPRSGQGHMSVGDSAEEFILIHAPGRERMLVFSCGISSVPLKILFFARWETIESFCLNFLHSSRLTCFQKRGRRPPQNTGRRVNSAYQGSVGAPNKLATFRVHDAVVDLVERSVWSTRNYAASNPRSA